MTYNLNHSSLPLRGTGGLSDNLQHIRQQIPPQTLLVAVSKNHSEDSILQAYACGQRHFAESRPQELSRKAQVLPKDIVWHFIGHLQTNKIKIVLPLAHLIHSVDSEHLLQEMERYCCANNCTANCLLQVHIAQEEQKFGFLPCELTDFFIQNKELGISHIRLQGLMGIATNTEDMDVVRSEFGLLKDLYGQVQTLKPNLHFTRLSMGMSGDYKAAIEMGSTLVRIGSGIFGERDYGVKR
jgi:pyridoxal phosphate enzyme (YggS family)